LCVKESFEEATRDLAELLGIAPSLRAAEVMSRQMAEFAPSFRLDQPPPLANQHRRDLWHWQAEIGERLRTWRQFY